jgi:hypothetical protein
VKLLDSHSMDRDDEHSQAFYAGVIGGDRRHITVAA